MSTDALKVKIEGAVARLVLARPQKHNAFDDTVIAAFTIALQRGANVPHSGHRKNPSGTSSPRRS